MTDKWGFLRGSFIIRAFACLFVLVLLTGSLSISVMAESASESTETDSGAESKDSSSADSDRSVSDLTPETFTQDRITYQILTYPEGEKDGTVRIVAQNIKKNVTHVSLNRFIVYKNHIYAVTEIGDAVFAMSAIEQIDIPWSVEKIGKACFYGCSALSSIEFSVKLQEIGDGAFSYCANLNSLKIDRYNNYLKIKNGIIYTADFSELVSGVRAEGDVTVNKKTVSIRPYAFEGNQLITSVTCQKGLKSIGARAFYDCGKLTSAVIPASVNEIEGNPFIYCDALTTISVASNNKKFCSVDNLLLSKSGKVVYSGMAASGEVILPEKVSYISAYAFCGNSKITGINFNSKFKGVREGAYYDCRNLGFVRFDSLKTEVSGGSETVPSFGNTTYFLEVSLPLFDPDGSCELYRSLLDNCPTKTIYTIRQ